MTPRAEHVVERLQLSAEPISASDLATSIGLDWVSHETRRRRVRESVDEARENGLRICANAAGYWIAESAAEWRAYLESRKSGARFEFVRTKRMKAAATDAGNEQGALFAGAQRQSRSLAHQ